MTLPLGRALLLTLPILLGGFVTSRAVAEVPATETPSPSPGDPADGPELEDRPEAGVWRPESFFAFAYGDEGETYTLHVGAEWNPAESGGFAVAPQLVFGAANNTDDVWSALSGFDLQLRWYQRPIGAWDWFFEAGAGVQYVGPQSYPRSGTHWNGRLRAGVGARYACDDRLDLLMGVGWLHMSNGNALQPNVGHDGPMFYLGISKTF